MVNILLFFFIRTGNTPVLIVSAVLVTVQTEESKMNTQILRLLIGKQISKYMHNNTFSI